MPETHDLLQSIQGLVPRIDDVLTTLDNAASAWTTYQELSAAELQAKTRFNQVGGEIDRIQIELRSAESVEEKSRTLIEELVRLDDAYRKVSMRWKEIVDELTAVFEQTIEPTHKLVVFLSYEISDALRSLPAAPPELRATRDEIERLMLSVGLLTDLRTDGGGRKHAQLLPLKYRRRDLLSMKCRLTEMERLISGEPASEPSIPNPIRPHPPAVAASSNKPRGRQAHQVGTGFTHPKRRGPRPNLTVSEIRNAVMRILEEARKEGSSLTQQEICERLDAGAIPLPPRAKWRHWRSWSQAYAKARGAFKSWLSAVTVIRLELQ